MYNLRILDINRRRIAVIDRLESWRYTRRPSEATELTITLPREDVEAALPAGVDLYAFLAPYQVVSIGTGTVNPTSSSAKHEQAQIAHYVEIYRGTQHVVTGRISKRDVGDTTVTITCYTEEIELESHVTPAQYGRKWDHWDLADVARDMLRGWHVQRVKDKTQWDAAIERVNVDTSTEPGVVMLAKSGGKYVSQGHITLRFSKADVPGFHSWDRIRWASDNVAPVRTTMQWRADGGPWSQEMEGALPDEVGVVPGSANADVIDVRINLYTEDQEAEDANGNPVGVTPYVFAVEMIARTEGRIEAGDIPAAAGVLVSGLEADGASALNVLSQACEQAGWEFWVSDGKLNLAEEMGEDRTSSVLLRAGTNMTVQTLSEGDDELVNVLVAYGPGEGINRLQVTRRHEESIARYGEYRGVQTFEGATTLAALIDAADAYLADHAAPVPAFRVDVHYPHGEEPEFGVGDYVRVADPRSGIITRSRIAEEQRSYSTSGLKTTLYLGLPAPNLARTVRPTPPPRPVQPPDKPVISVSPIPGGIRVVDTKAPNVRWATSEVHVSVTKGFTPSAETLVADGRRVRFDVGGLTPDMRYYVRLIRFDTDGNASEPSDEMSVVAGKFPQEELPADLFQIKATSDVEPDSGSLESLWDQDTTTGAAWASGPVTVTFEYPMQWFFDMVRLYTTTARAYYVEARTKEGTWTQVTGNQQTQANGWTVQRFASNKMVVTDALRITFTGSGPVDLRELKFWTVTLADEILAQVLRLTDGVEIVAMGGDGRTPHMSLNARRQVFRNSETGLPSVGIGDTAAEAAELVAYDSNKFGFLSDWSNSPYGILLGEGAIYAWRAIKREALVDRSIVGRHIEQRTIRAENIEQKAITVYELSDQLMVPDVGRVTLLRYQNSSASQRVTSSSWTTVRSWSLSKRDDATGYFMERICVRFGLNCQAPNNAGATAEARLRINNQVVAQWSLVVAEEGEYEGSSVEAYIDFRGYSDGLHDFDIQIRHSSTGIGGNPGSWISDLTVHQNEQLPIRPGTPIYSIQGGQSGGCYTTCQTTAERPPDPPPPPSDEPCTSTCEMRAQGGGCIREGTSILVWDPESRVYKEVPVEQLQPGMILPGYNPENDSVEHGVLLQLVYAGRSPSYLRIHTDNGPCVDVTATQPFDVLADFGQGLRWYKLPTKYLRPGMKLVRPFEQGGPVLSTITKVEEVRDNDRHFWLPKTTVERFTVAGYADAWFTKE